MKNKTMATMKLKKLQYALENIKTFKNPKIELEQYTTMPHLAACVLHTAQFVYGDIMGKCVADLGCGSGMLCIGAALLNAKYCAGYIYLFIDLCGTMGIYTVFFICWHLKTILLNITIN